MQSVNCFLQLLYYIFLVLDNGLIELLFFLEFGNQRMLLLSSNYFCLTFSLINIFLHFLQLKPVIIKIFLLQLFLMCFFLSLGF